MTIAEWQEILDCEGLSDVLTADDYNESYSHDINLTVKEIRDIANMLKAQAGLEDAVEFGYRQCEEGNNIQESVLKFRELVAQLKH